MIISRSIFLMIILGYEFQGGDDIENASLLSQNFKDMYFQNYFDINFHLPAKVVFVKFLH